VRVVTVVVRCCNAVAIAVVFTAVVVAVVVESDTAPSAWLNRHWRRLAILPGAGVVATLPACARVAVVVELGAGGGCQCIGRGLAVDAIVVVVASVVVWVSAKSRVTVPKAWGITGYLSNVPGPGLSVLLTTVTAQQQARLQQRGDYDNTTTYNNTDSPQQHDYDNATAYDNATTTTARRKQ